MQSRYFLELSSRVPNAGMYPVKLGLPIPEDMQNNICICCRGSSDFIPLNLQILRQALLENPDKTSQLLGIKVVDLLQQPKVETKPFRPKGRKGDES